ncbi:hypothetical protein [Endozoicomonas arenosclerae]|uniref:hypothetical protein n=1 Tax=Endozoicomonas arenosclerae TaxID=1633495 RepID=UPI00129471C9|nr:hypothetical protein [Endozoicomonas arenosclerae]
MISVLGQQDPANHVVHLSGTSSTNSQRYSERVQKLVRSMQESTNIQVQSLSEGVDDSLWQPTVTLPAIEAILLSMESELNDVELTEELVLQALQLAGIHFQILATGSQFENASPLDRAVKLWLLFKFWLINRLGLQVDEQTLAKLMNLIFEGMGNTSFPVEDIEALMTNPTPLIASTPGQLASTALQLQLEGMTAGQQLSFDVPHNGILIAQNLGSGQFLLVLNNNLTVTTQNQNQLQKILSNLFSFTLGNYQPPSEPEYMPPLPVQQPQPVSTQSLQFAFNPPTEISPAGEAIIFGSRLLVGTVVGLYLGSAVNQIIFGSPLNNGIPTALAMLLGQVAVWSTPYDLSPRFTWHTQQSRAYARQLWRFLRWLTQVPEEHDEL